MRGTASSAKMRLRSGGFKCHLCGRRVVDAALLNRHLKTIHNISNKKKVLLKVKPTVQEEEKSDNDMEKVFDGLLRGDKMLSTEKPKPKNKKTNSETSELRVRIIEDVVIEGPKKSAEPAKNGANVKSVVKFEENGKNSQNKRSRTDVRRRAEFECPVCTKTFNVYFTAHRHIQKSHPINSAGVTVPLNSPDLIQPIRVEECVKCSHKMRSTETHICPAAGASVEIVSPETATQHRCAVCNQSFISVKMFDIHVAGAHCDAVESMFFPNKLEFTNWRLDMERQTIAKYTKVAEYDSKMIYRCNYSCEDQIGTVISHCPSTMVVQTFSKGIQVHFYPKHHNHPGKQYTLSGKYLHYSISSFLKNPKDLKIATSNRPLDHKDMYAHFKILMQGIVTDSKDLNVPTLKILIDKALEMANVINSAEKADLVVKPNKHMSDKEIEEALEPAVVKRRNSEDVGSSKLSPAKRTRNKSMFVQTGDKSSPKIVNAFSLADSFDFNTETESTNTNFKSKQNVKSPKVSTEGKETDKSSKLFTTPVFNQSPSFNDSYKEFIDKTIQGTFNIGKKLHRRNDYNTRSSRINDPVLDILKTSPLKTVHDPSELNTSAKTLAKKVNSTANTTILTTTPKNVGIKRPNNNINITGTPKIATLKNVSNISVNKAKSESPVAKRGPKTPPKPKQSPKLNPITPKDEILSEITVEVERMTTPPLLKPKAEIKYEVRERDNDCNILVLKI